VHDADYSDETMLLTATAVDDDWRAGYVGLCHYRGGSAVPQCDDVIGGECGHEVRERK